ncbi:hypothetical protein RSPO_c01408 [Ralstonia solanacearum Po82]|uniref:Uncharacterized protein n=1 Tax=Ralstonia solanacearum (strain Po82) TaxID=1031711 RepID=F6G0C5_RALS8|nr:hypothetical protein RSPO_c01408 [Ralstonia solanacearum Po82]
MTDRESPGTVYDSSDRNRNLMRNRFLMEYEKWNFQGTCLRHRAIQYPH